MEEDHAIVEKDLSNQLANLKQELHMKKVKSLGMKLQGLRKMTLQRQLISSMSRQVEELEPTVSKIYSPQNALKDNEIKGYLIYLLHLDDFFSREVETKKDIIQQRDEQINQLLVKLCTMRNEYAKKKKSVRSMALEFTQLENMSNKMSQLEQRLSSLKTEIKGQRQNILDMRVFQKRYKNLENKFREQITRLAEDVQRHLDTAVATYEEREEFTYKAKIYKDRCIQDLQKADLNENALQLVLDETEQLEEFEDTQSEQINDSRISVTGELIEQGITGLESELDRAKELKSAIVHSSNKEDADLIEDHYKLTDDKTKSVFCYMEQLLKDIEQGQDTINELKEDSRKMHKNLTTQERRLKWEIGEEKKLAEELGQEALSCESSLQDARGQLHSLLEKIQSLRQRCSPQDAEEQPDAAGSDAGTTEIEAREQLISESNAIDFNESIHKEILRLLMGMECRKVEELTSEEDVSTLSIGENEEPQGVFEETKIESIDTIQPRQ